MKALPFVVLWATACSSPTDRFFVRRAGADLPVWRQGPEDAEILVLMTHGSGASGQFYDWFEAFDEIEADYAVVYWDMRGQGASQGNPADDTLTAEDLRADLALVRTAVVERYAPDNLVLMGHSLGAGLTLGMLTDPEQRAGIDGYIDVSGAHNAELAYDQVRRDITSIAREATRDDLVAFYETHEDLPQEPDIRAQHISNLYEANQLRGYDQAAVDGSLQAEILGRAVAGSFGTFDALAFLGNTSRFTQAFDFRTLDTTDKELEPIALPTLFVAGTYDLSVPIGFSEEAFEDLDSDRPHAVFVELETGHWPMFEDPEGFAGAVTDWLADLP